MTADSIPMNAQSVAIAAELICPPKEMDCPASFINVCPSPKLEALKMNNVITINIVNPIIFAIVARRFIFPARSIF